MNADRDDAVATVATKHQTAADVFLTLPRTPMVGVSRFDFSAFQFQFQFVSFADRLYRISGQRASA